MTIEIWTSIKVDNHENDDTILAFEYKNRYYFENTRTDEESPRYRVFLGRFFLNHWKAYQRFEMILFSGRRQLFTEEMMKDNQTEQINEQE